MRGLGEIAGDCDVSKEDVHKFKHPINVVVEWRRPSHKTKHGWEVYEAKLLEVSRKYIYILIFNICNNIY